MSTDPTASLDAPPPDDASPRGLLRLVAVAVLAGAVTGLVGGLFRLVLAWCDLNMLQVLAWAREAPAWRWVLPVVAAATAVALARLIVRYVPSAAGSGIQRVEAIYRSQIKPVGIPLLPAKFVGGVLALGSGMALGREGPTIQMGASVGDAASRLGRVDAHDRRVITTAAAGAGLGVAFAAPLGGALFVFEEVAHAFRTRLVLATMAAVVSASVVARYVTGNHPIFQVGEAPSGAAAALIPYFALGLVLGLAGVAYNRLVIALLDLAEPLRSVPPEVKAAGVGVVIGVIGMLAPWLIGSGELLNQTVLDGSLALSTLIVVLLVRFVLGPLCYSVSTPGGLFAPLMLVGAAAGALFAAAGNAVLPGLSITTTSAAIVGMSTFFVAVVRAPLTGIIIVVEMTATTSVLIPMLVAAVGAQLVATQLRSQPVYDILRHRLPEIQRRDDRG